jgi:hypothetical protein
MFFGCDNNNNNNNNNNSIGVYLRTHIIAQMPITKLGRIERKTQKYCDRFAPCRTPLPPASGDATEEQLCQATIAALM